MDNSGNLIVVVDRSVKPVYPEYVTHLVLPALEQTGPPQFDAAVDLKVMSCAHKGRILTDARFVLNSFDKEGFLPSCLGILDGLAIQAMGVEIFRAILKHLELKEIHLWRSAGSNGPKPAAGIFFASPTYYLPVLIEQDDAVVIEWRDFDGKGCSWLRWVDTVHFVSLLPNRK